MTVVKDDIMERFENKFQEIKVKGNRKSVTGVREQESSQGQVY